MSVRAVCVSMLCKLYKDGKNSETPWGLRGGKKSSACMYTADVKVVRHQRSFAKFTYACPNQALSAIFITSGWEVQPTVQFHWSKIPVLLAVYQTSNVFRSEVILFLQTLIVVLFLHQRVRTVSLSPAVCP